MPQYSELPLSATWEGFSWIKQILLKPPEILGFVFWQESMKLNFYICQESALRKPIFSLKAPPTLKRQSIWWILYCYSTLEADWSEPSHKKKLKKLIINTFKYFLKWRDFLGKKSKQRSMLLEMSFFTYFRILIKGTKYIAMDKKWLPTQKKNVHCTFGKPIQCSNKKYEHVWTF